MNIHKETEVAIDFFFHIKMCIQMKWMK